MCGIVGYIGKKQAFPIIVNGLKRLEYRGYDSAGVALLDSSNNLNVYKKQGKVEEMEKFALKHSTDGCIGIGHTRWATHGEANDVNAHPHINTNGDIAIIHNGIIENYVSLKTALIERGYVFRSQTDTEVIAHLIDDIQKNAKVDLAEAVRLALNEVVGAYAIVVISKNEPDKLIVAKMSSPMVIGFGEDELYVASDGSPLIEHTKKVSYIEDGQMAILHLNGNMEVKNLTDNLPRNLYFEELSFTLEEIEKGGFEHFMMKEIHEQPQAIYNSIRGRMGLEQMKISLGGINQFEGSFRNTERIVIVACGTSWHSALIGKYLFEEFARINVDVEYASEFRYRNPKLSEKDIVIAISQSGETADTKAALELAKQKGALTYGICNVVGSSIARLSDAGSYTHAGPEIGVASTKAFTTQVSLLVLMALQIADIKGTISTSLMNEFLNELDILPKKIEKILESDKYIEKIAKVFQHSTNFLYLGRGYNFPVALEGALKLKEISYIHAEGYPAAEMKHGPIALIDENMPVVVLAPHSTYYDKLLSNVEEVKTRKGRIIAVVTEGDELVKNLAEYVIKIPNTIEALSPILTVIPLQLLAYHIAVLRGCNVDQPRNLAKSVTVE
ncbi:MAG: glutamine--fructose-6-phosphate transaminase (isomerizing) [Chitinophagales bacterium]|nr:glutamine--fructose-6-phosphate transaminase (isomerizing) [Chitinophagales bacterium]